MRVIILCLCAIIAAPSFALGAKIKDNNTPKRANLNQNVRFSVKVSGDVSHVVLRIKEGDIKREMTPVSGKNRWETDCRFNSLGDIKYKISIYDKKGKKDDEEESHIYIDATAISSPPTQRSSSTSPPNRQKSTDPNSSDAQQRQYGSISGRVHKGFATGPELGDVTVSCGGRSTSTNRFGDYKVSGIPAGDQWLTLSLAGYETYRVNVNIRPGKELKEKDHYLVDIRGKRNDSQRDIIDKVINKVNTVDYVNGQCSDRGPYTWCYAFARQFYGLPRVEHADDAFYELQRNPLYRSNIVREGNFTNIPVGALVFWRGGDFGHAAIKVNERDVVGEGNPGNTNKNDKCRVTMVDHSSIRMPILGYYMP